MTYYIVKKVSKSTDNNPSFRRKTSIIYYGKLDKMLAWEGDYYKAHLADPLEDNAYMVSEYGYKTEGLAKHNYVYNHPGNNEYWKSTVEIIAVEIVDGKVVEVER